MEQKIIRVFAALAMGLLFAVTLTGAALAQETQVSGTITSITGERLPGVTVQVRGTTTTTTTDANGKYTITAPSDGVLLFALIGYKGTARTISGRPQIDIVLDPAVAVLEPVIVTGYTSQRRADITGSVGSVNVEGTQQQTSTSVLQRLDGRVPGVTVEAGGAPGSRSTVRIRGVTGFQNNDPLYVVDGTPVSESYMNFLNPNDIASMQVLKDGSAASIYGSRASNGVIIIETKKGRPGQQQVTLDVRTGVASPTHGYDDILMLSSLQYAAVVRQSYVNAGAAVPKNIFGDPNSPSVPPYIWPNDGVGQSCNTVGGTCTMAVDPSTYSYPNNLIMPGSPGTNWWKAVFGSAQFRDANLAVSGGNDNNAYHVSLNYLDQDGTAKYTRFQRGGARINTTFNVGRASIGENVSVSREQHHGAEGLTTDEVGEGNIVGKNIFMQPVIPVHVADARQPVQPRQDQLLCAEQHRDERPDVRQHLRHGRRGPRAVAQDEIRLQPQPGLVPRVHPRDAGGPRADEHRRHYRELRPVLRVDPDQYAQLFADDEPAQPHRVAGAGSHQEQPPV